MSNPIRFKIEYGINNNYKDVTNIALHYLVNNNILSIPAGNGNTDAIFEDHLPGVIKHIRIITNNQSTIYTNIQNVNLDISSFSDLISKVRHKNTILFTNARDEDNILEWVVHHLLLGFNDIWIFDHRSIIPIKEVLKNVPVRVIRVDEDIIKTQFMQTAITIAKICGYKWMMYLDADEFLVLNKDSNINDFLNRYTAYDQLSINWLVFGSNNYDSNPSGTILENYIKSDKVLYQYVKSIAKVNAVTGAYDPHCFNIPNRYKALPINGGSYVHDMILAQPINGDFNEATAYVAHYVYQSYETYVKRKVRLPQDNVLGKFRDIKSKTQIHSQHNEIFNTFPRDKYNERNKKEMLKYKTF